MGEKISKKIIFIGVAFFVTLVLCGAVSAANADVQVNQTVNNNQPNLNANVTLNTTVTNNGPDTATGVQVTNKLPSGLIYKGYTASQGTYNSTTGIWNVGTLNSGQLATLFINATVNQTGTIKNTANKTAETEIDPNLDNNMQEVVLNVPKAVDISVNQYLWYSSATYYYSNTPVFVVDVRNIGNYDDATNVIVRYTIADGYEYIATNTRGVGTATYDPLTKTITWIIPYMPKGAESTPGAIAFMNVYVRALDTGVKTTNLTNTAQLVSVDQYDYNNANNQKSYAITVPTAHDIQVNQNYTTFTDVNGDQYVTYYITAINNGPDDATGVTIKDLLPSGLEWIYNIQSTGTTYDKNTGIWYIGNFNYGDVVKTLNITAKILQTTGTIKNTAFLTAPLLPNFLDWNYDNNAQTTVLVLSGDYAPKTNITVNQYLWYSSATYYYSNTPVFVVDVRNVGNTAEFDDATNVIVRYTIADGYEYIATNTRGVGTATYDPLTKTITWIIPYMPKGAESTPGAIAFMNVYVRALDTGVKTTNLTNTVTLVSPVYAVQPSKSYSITVPEAHDIQVDQNVTGSTNYDDTITITITATNNGPDNATGVTIKDLLPSGLEWVSNTQSSGTTYDKTTGIWYIGNFNYGNAPKTLNITVRVKTTGTIKNTAFLTAPLLPNFLDWNYDNNAQTCVIEVPAAADIGVDQTINDTTPNYLDTVTITVYGKNYGPDYATNVKITDLLSPGLEYVSHTTNHGNYTNGVWTINNLQNGEEATLTIIAKVIEACSFNNTVNRTGGSQFDYNPSNDVKNVTLNVPEAAYIEVNKTATPSNPNYKDTVTYTITATNKGPDNATGVNINYTLPTGITLIGSSATKGSYTNGVWNIGSLQNGETVTLTITALINATGTITDNSLTVTQDQDIWNNTLPGPVNWNIPQSADIEVTQTVSNSTPTANNNVNFIINTTNNGPDNASGVEVTSKLPTGFTVSGWKVSWNGGLNWINNDSSYNPTTGLWTIGALTNGVKAILNITANARQMGNFTNNANKTAETQYDWNNTNNGQNVSLAVTGTIPDDIFTDEGTQSGTVNTDDGTTTAITLPFNITLYGQTYNTIYITVNGAIGLGAPIQGPYYYQLPESNTLNRYVAYIAPFWADFDVAHIGSVTYLITNNQINITWYQVPCHSDNWNSNRVNTVTLIITNESTYGFIYGDLDWKNDPDDSYPSYARISKGDNGATYKNFWTGAQALSVIANKTIWFDSNGNIISPHIGLNYTVNNSTPNYHDNVVYTIVATNTGTINATGVKVKALLPSGLNYVSSSSTDYDSATGIWNIGTLAPGESLILTLTAYVNKVGSIISYANTTAQDQYETNAYDSKSLTITVPNAADIAVAMTATTYTPRVGNDFYITITVTNNGPSTATGVQITDLLPYALQYRSTTYTSQGSYSSTTGVWNIGTLTSGQTATLTIRVRPRNGYGGQTVTNTATKTAETQYDPLTSNDSASINLNIRS